MRELIERRLVENDAMRQQNLARLQQLKAEQEQLVADINANQGADQALRIVLADLDKAEAEAQAAKALAEREAIAAAEAQALEEMEALPEAAPYEEPPLELPPDDLLPPKRPYRPKA